MGMLGMTLALASGTASAVDPVALSARGMIECTLANEIEKTCLNMATYRRQADGTIISEDETLINHQPPVIIKSRTKVTVRGEQMCGAFTDPVASGAIVTIAGQPASEAEAQTWRTWYRDQGGALIGQVACATYTSRGKSVTITSIGGLAARSNAIPVRWVHVDEGYALVHSQPGELVVAEDVGPIDVLPSSP